MNQWAERLNKRPDGPPLLYQALEHPDFKDWESLQPCAERWALIESAVDLSRPGMAVDFGCHTGWFCRQFARAGWLATGYDRDPFYLEVARETHPDLLPRPRSCHVELESLEIPKADVGLALSVLMYLFPDNGWPFLERVSQNIPTLFVDFGGAMAGSLPFDEESFPAKLLFNTQYQKVQLLGRAAFDRPFFVCTK
jgi:hypothetical protein